MPPLSESRAGQPVAARHESSPVASVNAKQNVDDLRTTVQEALTNFVTDTMYDKPQNVLQYMVQWAEKHLEAKKKQRASLSPTPPPRSTGVARNASRGASKEAAYPAANPQTKHARAADKIADQIMLLARSRQQHFHDKADGCRDHYLMSLEDSDGDIFHANALQKKMMASRKAEMDAKADTAAVADRLQEIEESAGTAEEKAQRRTEMLLTYQRLWKDELPTKRVK